MSQCKDLASVLPPTHKLTKQSFILFLKRYRDIIVKPSVGSGGVGVIQIKTKDRHLYTIHIGKYKKQVYGATAAYAFIRSKIKRIYVVQPTIKLATIAGRPFDVRVMVQRKRGSQRWVITGILAKVAGSGYFITNLVRSKGAAYPLTAALNRSNIRNLSAQRIQQKIEHTARKATLCLQRQYRLRNIGLDLGIDHNGNVWIIEANFSPDLTYFLRLKNKAMYKRMLRYART